MSTKKKAPPPLDWTDREALTVWLDALESAALDVIDVAEDQTSPPAERDYGRRSARALIAEQGHSVTSLIAYARASIPSPYGDPSGSSSPAH